MDATLEHLFAEFRRTGEPAPLGEVFDRTSPQLLAMALHLCGHPADAEDALQTTFVTAIARADAWHEQRPLLPWLFGILQRRCQQVGERRQRRRESQLAQCEPALPDSTLPDSTSHDGNPLGASERRELIATLRQHIEQLPGEQRQVLLLQLEHGLSPAEVAEVLGIAPGTVRMRLHRAVKALRGLMPAGLVTVLVGTLQARGLAAVRAAVVRHASGAAVGVAAGGGMVLGSGALLMKKVLVGVVLLLLLITGWAVAAPAWSDADRVAAPPVALVATPAAPPKAEPLAPAPESSSPQRELAKLVDVATPELGDAFGALLVRITRRDSGLPVPNVPVRIVPDRSDIDPRFAGRTAVTGASGTCLVDAVATGAVRVEAMGGLQCTVAVRSAETAIAELLLLDDQAPLQAVRGRVLLPDGRPAAHANIVTGPQAGDHAEVIAQADAAGRFEVTIAARFLLIGARMQGFAPTPLRSFREGQDIELVLPAAGAELQGLVVDAAGKPLAGATVVVGKQRGRGQWTDPGGWLMVTPPPQPLLTNDEGQFHAVDLVAGEIECLVRADGLAPFHCFVTTVAGNSVTVRCELASGMVVTGRVLDQLGKPVVGAYVSLGGSYGEARATDAEGRFGYRHVAPGPLQLEVQGAGIERHFCERGPSEAGEWLVVVKRLPLYRLRLVDEVGQPLVGWRVQLRPVAVPPSVTDALGTAALYVAAGAEPTLWLLPPGGIHAVVPWPVPAGLLVGSENTIVVPREQQPRSVLVGSVQRADGSPVAASKIEIRGPDDEYLYRQYPKAGDFRFEHVPAGDWVVEVYRAGGGGAGARFPVTALAAGELRDLGALTLPGEGSLQVRVLQPDGQFARDAAVFLFDDEGQESRAPTCNGEAQRWPEGSYRWKVMADGGLWQSGQLQVRQGMPTMLEIVVVPGVRRYVRFPVPMPDWGDPGHVAFVLRAPDGSEYDRGDFDPKQEMPYRYMPPLSVGAWRVELTLADGRRFAGGFDVASLEPSLEPISVAVEPSR